jgi:hypothetical protein
MELAAPAPEAPKTAEQIKHEQQRLREFATGSTLWANGVQFAVVSNEGNILTLKPVTARIS